jgi:hypothetical protein
MTLQCQPQRVLTPTNNVQIKFMLQCSPNDLFMFVQTNTLSFDWQLKTFDFPQVNNYSILSGNDELRSYDIIIYTRVPSDLWQFSTTDVLI